jgi:opacity protein-like surface antigen
MHALSRALAASMFTLVAAPSLAVAQDSGPYASVFGGINILHDNDFQIGSSDPSLTGFSVLPAKMFFDAGGAVGAAVGYDWGSFAAEAELSGRRGMFDHEEIFVGAIPLEGHYDAISLMANGYYRFHNDTRFIPYVGLGAGVAFLSAKVTPSGAPSLDISDTRAAVQAIAGIAIPLGERAELGVEYRYFTTDRPSYAIDLGGVPGTANIGYNSSNVLVRLNWKFN